MRRPVLLAALCCAVATACSDRPTQPAIPDPTFAESAAKCITPGGMEHLIRTTFQPADHSTVLNRFRDILQLFGSNPTEARRRAIDLVNFTLERLNTNRLVGGSSPDLPRVVALLNGFLCNVGLPKVFTVDALGDDGAVGIISPNDPTTTVVTETQHAGVEIPGGSVEQPTVVTIRRLPDSPFPLLTEFDQYPQFYEYHSTAGFTQDVLVGVCVAVEDQGLLSRLRLAHNVPAVNPTTIEVLPFAPVPFVSCGDIEVGSGAPRGMFDLAGGLLGRALAALGPQPLHAMRKGGGGIGGTVRNFSPFGAVDTLAFMTRVPPLEQHVAAGSAVGVPPAVVLTTPRGHLMSGVPVTFAILSGSGTITGGLTASDANGRAAVLSWTIGFGPNQLSATASAPAGLGFLGSPATFFARGQ